jgi:hypothetical protein
MLDALPENPVYDGGDMCCLIKRAMALSKWIDESDAVPARPEAPGLPAQFYRPDIDGLRAIAILPFMFHAGLEIFSGGFVGVDVFFVISGYPITTIIANNQTHGVFSICNFTSAAISDRPHD